MAREQDGDVLVHDPMRIVDGIEASDDRGRSQCSTGHDTTEAHEHLDIDTTGFDAVYLEIEST